MFLIITYRQKRVRGLSRSQHQLNIRKMSFYNSLLSDDLIPKCFSISSVRSSRSSIDRTINLTSFSASFASQPIMAITTINMSAVFIDLCLLGVWPETTKLPASDPLRDPHGFPHTAKNGALTRSSLPFLVLRPCPKSCDLWV